MTKQPYITHRNDLHHYAPPGHSGTVNVRLVDKAYTGTFEMIHGTIEPDCEAHRHSHKTETQICYVLEGEMEISFGDDPPVKCAPGTVVAIPPELEHRIVSSGREPLKLIVIYSPPLPPRDEVPVHKP
jgi:mannose-6-phosphate isomerase-like protein (cupin superfamily)